jgi:hypothetical protein
MTRCPSSASKLDQLGAVQERDVGAGPALGGSKVNIDC